MKKYFYLVGLWMVGILFASERSLASAVITTQPASTEVCSGATARFFITTAPAFTNYMWSLSTDGGTTWMALTDSGIFSGSATDTLSVSASLAANGYQFMCTAAFGTDTLISSAATLTVDTLAVASISGASHACAGGSITLSDVTTGGSWSNRNNTIDTVSMASGIVYGLATGSDSIFYSVSNSCGTTSAFTTIMFDTSFVASITGMDSVCAGSILALYDSTMGGTWTNLNPAIDSVDTFGNVYATMAGSDSVKYTVTNSCGSFSAAFSIRIDTLPAAITGGSMVCIGSSLTLNDAVIGGMWTHTGSTTDTLTSVGVLTSTNLGTDSVFYTVTNSCGTNSAMQLITVITLPSVMPIMGSSVLCAGGTDTLSDSTSGGTWTNGNGVVDTVMGGVVMGRSRGTDSVYYTVVNMCGSSYVATMIRVDTLPTAITGGSIVCIGSTLTLADGIPGGIWSKGAGTHDSLSASGVVHGVSVGTDQIFYSLSNACGNDTATLGISIQTVPAVAAISGVSVICAGGIGYPLSDVDTGGVWSHHNMINDSLTSNGYVYGMHVGTDTIFYTLTNTCGATTVHKTISINAAPVAGTISGPSSLCAGSTIVLAHSIYGGVWGHLHNTIDSIHGTGYLQVLGRNSGRDTITYTVTNSCGTAKALFPIRVDTLNPGIISGLDTFCGNSTDTLHVTATGGSWSSLHSSLVAVSPAGVLTGGIIGGSDSVLYTISNSCGTRSSYFVVYAKPAPYSGILSGSSHVCVGSAIHLHDTTHLGSWYHTGTSLDSIHLYALDSVSVTGLSAGHDTIMYVVNNSCGADTTFQMVSVDTTVHPTAITGSSHVCVAATTTLSCTPAGGSWVSRSVAKATISSAGVLTGVSAGTDTVLYIISNGCGNDTASAVNNVLALPALGTISGGTAVCLGDSLALSESVSGTWSFTNANATITTTGEVYAMNPGLDTVLYTVSNAQCTGHAWLSVAIDTVPAAYPIMGASTVCIGNVILLSDANTQGMYTWASSNHDAAVATSGIITGMIPGMDTIMYYFANACGTDTESAVITIQTHLTGGMLSGPTTVCLGSQVTFTDTSAGGVWLSGNATNASVDLEFGPDAVVTGRTIGTSVISYTYWNACGSATDTATLHVLGEALPITGSDSLGVGVTRVFGDGTTGGTWSLTNTTYAHIDTTGKVKGYGPGTDTLIYSVTNACGTSNAELVLYIGNPPSAGTIVHVGNDTICVGLNMNLFDTSAAAPGIWSCKYGNASVDQYGVVTGIAGAGLDSVYYSTLATGDTGRIIYGVMKAGFDSVIYTVTNGFGSSKSYYKIFVNSVPVVKVSHYIVSVGGHYPMLDTPNTGTWTSSNPLSIAFHNDGPNQQTMFVLAVANDTLVYTVYNLCGTTTDTLFYSLATIEGVKDVNEISNRISIMPNPNNGSFDFVLASNSDESAHISITNIMGQEVESFDVPCNRSNRLDINAPDGIYVVTAITKSGRQEARIVITH